MNARRRGHVFVGQIMHAGGGIWQRQAEFLSEAAERRIARWRIEFDLAACEISGIKKAEVQVGVGQRRRFAAASVAGGSRDRTCAARPDLQQAKLVLLRDAAA